MKQKSAHRKLAAAGERFTTFMGIFSLAVAGAHLTLKTLGAY